VAGKERARGGYGHGTLPRLLVIGITVIAVTAIVFTRVL